MELREYKHVAQPTAIGWYISVRLDVFYHLGVPFYDVAFCMFFYTLCMIHA